MGLGSHAHPPNSPPSKGYQLVSGLASLPYEGVKKVYKSTKYIAKTGINATHAMGAVVARATQTKVAVQPEHVYIPSAREPVRSRMRIAEAEAAKAKNGGSANKSKVKKPVKKPVKKLVKKPVKKPVKKLVKKPVVKPARKKVAPKRVSK
jgi:hypothetical protein